jgi:hypothetical protein
MLNLKREFATAMYGLESKKRADDLETIVDLTTLRAALANACIDDIEKRTEEARIVVFGFKKSVDELPTIKEQTNTVVGETSLHADLLIVRGDGSCLLEEELSTIVEECSTIVNLNLTRKPLILSILGWVFDDRQRAFDNRQRVSDDRRSTVLVHGCEEDARRREKRVHVGPIPARGSFQVRRRSHRRARGE